MSENRTIAVVSPGGHAVISTVSVSSSTLYYNYAAKSAPSALRSDEVSPISLSTNCDEDAHTRVCRQQQQHPKGTSQKVSDADVRRRSVAQSHRPVRDAAVSPAVATAERICYSSPGPARATVAYDTAAATSGSVAARKADTP